jgi:hypothetical protein
MLFLPYSKVYACNIRPLYRSGSLKMVARELGKYKVDLVGVQEARWQKGSGLYIFVWGRE